jgi:hypothetical protein
MHRPTRDDTARTLYETNEILKESRPVVTATATLQAHRCFAIGLLLAFFFFFFLICFFFPLVLFPQCWTMEGSRSLRFGLALASINQLTLF